MHVCMSALNRVRLCVCTGSASGFGLAPEAKERLIAWLLSAIADTAVGDTSDVHEGTLDSTAAPAVQRLNPPAPSVAHLALTALKVLSRERAGLAPLHTAEVPWLGPAQRNPGTHREGVHTWTGAGAAGATRGGCGRGRR
jgi:hypothetical protein